MTNAPTRGWHEFSNTIAMVATMDKEQAKAIWIVDDDTDDHELLKDLFKEMQWSHPLEVFSTGEEFIQRLKEAPLAPFVIISDVRLGRTDGFSIRQRMLEEANNKFHSVPFIFWSTDASETQIRKAYRLRAHGFFRKESDFSSWKKSLIRIIEYWTTCLTPSKEDKPDPPLV